MKTTNPSDDDLARLAGRWDTLRAGFLTENVRERAIAKAYLHPSMAVASVGAGTGFMAAGLAPLVQQVHVLDASAEMLAAARQNLSAFSNVNYHRADGLALPLPDASLDAMFADAHLPGCPDPQAALREVVRTLKPGGRLVLTEVAEPWRGIEHPQIRSWLEQAGLVNILVESTSEDCQEAAGEQAPFTILVATGTKRMQVHAAVQESYASQALGAGCGCSDPGCCTPGTISLETVDAMVWDGGYSLAEKAEIPEEAALISLGCGNPLAMAGLKPGETVLDIGSGGGIDVFLAARRVGPEGAVIGVDMTPAMLQRARQAAEKGGYTNVKFRHGYAEKLPVPDASVDVVISNCVINLTEDKGKVFREVFRVLKENGRLEVNDVVFGGAVPPALRASLSGWAGCISGALPEQEYLDLVRQAGFREVQAQQSTSHGISNGVPVYSVQVSARK
ncbi:MAG: arsenite methyltransferase [Anaerolineales bacterium]|jgi:ubiquinone/menaquinone biosynthesis C-methylase UbiE|nr:arsenite methyltransferase [Anaerolineales bacterium]